MKASPASRRALRLLAVGGVVGGIVLPLARRRLGLPPAVPVAAAVAAPFGLAVAVPRTRLRDAAVYGLQMWAYIVVHELPYDDPRRLESRVLVDYPIRFDRAVFGCAPTVALQRVLARPGRTTALDHLLVYVHWAWFLQPHLAAAWILWRHPRRFPRAATMICAVFDTGLIGYFAVPTAPPWWAAEQGRLAGMRRIMAEVGQRVWGRLWSPLYGFLGGNPLAAMPSLHFATSLMAARMLAETGPAAAVAGWAYAGVLGFALVYLGEHYVIDLAAGAALVEVVRRLGPHAAPLLEAVGAQVRRLERSVA